jgi:tryptophan-rich sensory protein
MMGIAAYIIENNTSKKDNKGFVFYYLQLVFNFLWSFIFFNSQAYLASFIWIIVLLVLIILNTVEFYKINKVAAFLLIPYIIWVTFASVLNFSIYLLN